MLRTAWRKPPGSSTSALLRCVAGLYASFYGQPYGSLRMPLRAFYSRQHPQFQAAAEYRKASDIEVSRSAIERRFHALPAQPGRLHGFLKLA